MLVQQLSLQTNRCGPKMQTARCQTGKTVYACNLGLLHHSSQVNHRHTRYASGIPTSCQSAYVPVPHGLCPQYVNCSTITNPMWASPPCANNSKAMMEECRLHTGKRQASKSCHLQSTTDSVPRPCAALRTPHAHQPANRNRRAMWHNHEAPVRPTAPKPSNPVRSSLRHPARGSEGRTVLVLAAATPLRQCFTGSRGPAW